MREGAGSTSQRSCSRPPLSQPSRPMHSAQATATTVHDPRHRQRVRAQRHEFVSDVAITNPGTAPAIAILTLVPANGTSAVPPVPGAGPDARRAQRPPAALGRERCGGDRRQVHRAAPDPGAHVQHSGVRHVRSRAPGRRGRSDPRAGSDAAHSLWISQSADGSTGYRTNVAVVFPDSTGGDATVTVYDENGNVDRNRRRTRSRGRDFSSSPWARSPAPSPSGARADRRDPRPGGRLHRRRGQRDRRLVPLHVRGPPGGPPGRPRERRRARERPQRDVLQDGRADLQPGRPQTRGSRSLSTQTRTRTRARPTATFNVAGRQDPRRRGRPLLPPAPAGRLGGRAALHVRHARRDPLPDEQRGPEGIEARHVRRPAEADAPSSPS